MATERTSATSGPGDQPAPADAAGAPKQKFGLVLQGGGALGAYEAGAIECLYERGMECAIVAGASSGAMNAVTLAGAKDPPEVLRRLWAELAVDPKLPLPPAIRHAWSIFGVPHMYRPRLDYWRAWTWTYLTDNSVLKKTLTGLLDWVQVNDPSHMRLFVSATDIENGQTAYFGNTDGQRLTPEQVLASGSFPGGFPWTEIGNRAYWDGGLTDNTPLKPVIEHLKRDEPGSMPVYAIDVNTAAAPRPGNLEEVWLRMFELLVQNNLEGDIKRAGSYTKFIHILQEIEKNKWVPPDAEIRKQEEWKTVMEYAHVRHLHIVDIKKPPGDSPGDFAPESIRNRMTEGHKQMAAFLEKVGVP